MYGGGGLFAKSCPTHCSPTDCAYKVPLCFSRQKILGSRLQFSPGDFPDLGTKPRSPVFRADFLLIETLGKPNTMYSPYKPLKQNHSFHRR